VNENYLTFFLILFLTFLCSYFLCLVVIKIAKKYHFVITVKSDRFSKKSKPLLGGVAIFIAFWVGVFLFYATFNFTSY